MHRTLAITALAAIALTGCATSSSGSTDNGESSSAPANRYCKSQLETRALPAQILTWSNSMTFPLDNGGTSYQGDVDLDDGTHHSYICDVDSTGAVHRSGWLADFGG